MITEARLNSLRKHLEEWKDREDLSRSEYYDLRNEIKSLYNYIETTIGTETKTTGNCCIRCPASC